MIKAISADSQSAARSGGRSVAGLAWVLWALAVVFAGIGLVGLMLNRDTPVGPRFGPPGFPAFFAAVYATVGALIASRRPRNLIGWLFCWVGILSGIQILTEQYAVYAVLTRPGSLPAGVWLAWLQAWLWVPTAIPAWTFLPLLFPHGRLASPRWRPVAWLGLLGILIAIVGLAIQPGPIENFARVTNPLGLGQDKRPIQAVWIAGYAIVAAVTLAAAVSLILRLRRSTGETRAQLKWFAFAVAFLALTVPFGNSGVAVGQLAVIAATLGVPISVGIAVLRYRLWDIDVLIRRTLVYSVLTALLALIYFVSVIGLQELLGRLSGSAAQSQLVIVASTLAIAGLFAPLRRQVQNVIDRRFYRRKYDAAKSLAAFSATVRDEVEMDKLTERLVQVVEETMQPKQASLWLRQPERKEYKRGD